MNDFASMLNTSQIAQLEAKLSAFEKESSNEISLVIIPSLAGDTIENFAEKLFKEWGIGKAKNDNGVLLLVSRDDRKLRIEVGYGLEGALTDARSYSIIKNTLTPSFRRGDYYGGINSALDDIISATKGEYSSQKSGGRSLSLSFDDYFWILFYIIGALIWLSSIFARSKSWWAGGVVGGLAGITISILVGFLYIGLVSLVLLIPLGLLMDYLVSRAYQKGKETGHYPWWIGGGPHSGSGSSWGGGGFGGFGGGSSGGGGASGDW